MRGTVGRQQRLEAFVGNAVVVAVVVVAAAVADVADVVDDVVVAVAFEPRAVAVGVRRQRVAPEPEPALAPVAVAPCARQVAQMDRSSSPLCLFLSSRRAVSRICVFDFSIYMLMAFVTQFRLSND